MSNDYAGQKFALFSVIGVTLWVNSLKRSESFRAIPPQRLTDYVFCYGNGSCSGGIHQPKTGACRRAHLISIHEKMGQHQVAQEFDQHKLQAFMSAVLDDL